MKTTIYRHERVIWIGAVMLLTLAGSILAGIQHRRIVYARRQNESLHQRLVQLRDEAHAMRAELTRRSTTTPPPETQNKKTTDSPESTDLAAEWERRVTDRDRKIAALRQQLDEARADADIETNQETEETPAAARANRLAAWRERMQQRDPEEYARRQAEHAERLDRLAELIRERSEFIQQISTEGLNPEYLENHEALIERFDFFTMAVERIAADTEGSQTLELMPEIFRNLQGLDTMLQKQRSLMLDDLAHEMGYEGKEAEALVTTINKITEATTLPSPGALRGGSRRRSSSQAPELPRVSLP